MDSPDTIGLSAALARLNAEHGLNVGYQRAWFLIAEGAIPTVRDGVRHRIKTADLPAIAETLRARSRARAQAPRTRVHTRGAA